MWVITCLKLGICLEIRSIYSLARIETLNQFPHLFVVDIVQSGAAITLRPMPDEQLKLINHVTVDEKEDHTAVACNAAAVCGILSQLTVHKVLCDLRLGEAIGKFHWCGLLRDDLQTNKEFCEREFCYLLLSKSVV